MGPPIWYLVLTEIWEKIKGTTQFGTRVPTDFEKKIDPPTGYGLVPDKLTPPPVVIPKKTKTIRGDWQVDLDDALDITAFPDIYSVTWKYRPEKNEISKNIFEIWI